MAERLENERDQEIRQVCIDFATRIVGKPVYFADGSKYHDDVIEVAEKMYKFMTGK